MADNGGVKIRNLGPVMGAMQWLANNAGYQPPKDTIASIDPVHWPSALQPVRPLGPAGSEPLVIPYQLGSNINYTPRADANFTAAQLRALAQYPLARICIENVKDQLCRIPWAIQQKRKPGESRKDHKKRMINDPIVSLLRAFFEYPDGQKEWGTWLRPWVEDMMVIDAACLYMRRTKSGKLAQLIYVPGDDITIYIDDNGMTPPPPEPAYAQLWEGVPRVNLTTDQLLYSPRNICIRNTYASQLYGYAPIEQLATEIQIGAARLAYVLAFYAEGGIPNAIHIVPPEANPKQILQSMQWMNSELAGQLAKRRKMFAMQGYAPEGKDQVIFPPDPVLADAFDDLHIRKMSYGLYTSAQRLLKMQNRATAETNQESSEEESLMPLIQWVKGRMDFIIQRKMGYQDYEMVFDPKQELDAEKSANVQKILVSGGIRTPNEGREAVGDDPSSDDGANELGIQTATGRVNIAVQDAMELSNSGGGNMPQDDKPPKSTALSTRTKPTAKIGQGNLVKYKYGAVMVAIPDDSEVGQALAKLRAFIRPEDLRVKGLVTDPHVTVRYGYSGNTDAIKEYLQTQGPVTLKFGKTFAFDATENSDNVSPLCVTVTSSDLERMNAELGEYGTWITPTFDYHPHLTLAYIDPAAVDQGYTNLDNVNGMEITIGEMVLSTGDN